MEYAGSGNANGDLFCPELDVSPELGEMDTVYYMSLIGILCWMVELGCDIICGSLDDVVSFCNAA